MTTARWFSLITGCLAFFLNYSSEGNPPNFWDFLLVLTYKATAAFLIAAPMILEYLEREKEKQERCSSHGKRNEHDGKEEWEE